MPFDFVRTISFAHQSFALFAIRPDFLPYFSQTSVQATTGVNIEKSVTPIATNRCRGRWFSLQ